VHIFRDAIFYKFAFPWSLHISSYVTCTKCRSQWPRCWRRGPQAAHLLGLGFRIPPGPRIIVPCEFCVLSGIDLCVALITRPEESHRVRCVWVWSWSVGNEETLTHYWLLCHEKNTYKKYRSGYCGRYSDLLRARWSGNRIPVEVVFYAPVQTGPGSHPASYIMGTGSLSQEIKRPGVTLTTHPIYSRV